MLILPLIVDFLFIYKLKEFLQAPIINNNSVNSSICMNFSLNKQKLGKKVEETQKVPYYSVVN